MEGEILRLHLPRLVQRIGMLLEDFLATLNVCLGTLRVLGAGDMEQGVTFVCGCDTIDSNDDAIDFGVDWCFVPSEWITDNP